MSFYTKIVFPYGLGNAMIYESRNKKKFLRLQCSNYSLLWDSSFPWKWKLITDVCNFKFPFLRCLKPEMLIKNIVWRRPRKKGRKFGYTNKCCGEMRRKEIREKKEQKDFKAIKKNEVIKCHQTRSHVTPFPKFCVNDEVVHAIKVLASVSIPSLLFFLLFSKHFIL